jgi:LysR substrate binding domain
LRVEQLRAPSVPVKHPAAKRAKLNLADLRDESFIMFPREASPRAFDTVIEDCRKAGFEPTLGPSVPQLVSIVIW